MKSGNLAAALIVLLAYVGSFAQAQPTRLPTADEVKALQAKYRVERDKVEKTGVAKRFLPAIMDKANELAKKSDAALAAGRLAQAAEAIRQARWQLPYLPAGLPDNISRVIGNLRLRHAGEINALAFSPDGSLLATASADTLVKVWDLGNGHELFACVGHKDRVRRLAWTRDGKYIISAGGEKNIKVWDAKTGKEHKDIQATGAEVTALVVSQDGKHIITGELKLPGNPNGLFVYETATGKMVREVRDFPNKIDALALSNDGKMLAVGDDNGNTRLFQYPSFVDNINQPAFWTQQDPNGATYQLVFSPDNNTLVRCSPFTIKFYQTPLPGAPFAVGAPRAVVNVNGQRRAAFSRDGKTLYTGDFNGTISLWDPENPAQKVGEFKNAHTSMINGLVFSPDGNRLASCSSDFIVRLWDFDVILQSRDFEGHTAPVWTAGFSPDATRLISASADRTVKVWQRDTGKVEFNITDHSAPVTCAFFSPDGKLFASAGGDKVIRIFDANTGKPLRTCEGHQGTITFLDFSPDSKLIVSGGADRLVKIWDADTGKEKTGINDNPSIVAGVAFHPNGKQIAVANIDQTIRLYDISGKLQQSWNAHGIAVNGLAYSPDGTWLASCGADMAVVAWPLATPGANPIRLMGHTGPVSMVAFRNDSKHLVSCGADQTVKLWKLEGAEGKEVQTFRGHRDWVTGVAFSKDGFHIVSSSVDRRVKIWEITSRELPLLAEHSAPVLAVAVSPDGNVIATGSEDRTIKLWNAKTGVEIGTLAGHTSWVQALVFTPDSKRLISSGEESEIRFWNVSPPREIPRTPQQATLFGPKVINVKGGSNYLAIDPAGKTLFVWIPPPQKDLQGVHRIDVMNLAASEFKYDVKEAGRIVKSLVVSANGKFAATGGADGSVRLWDFGPDKAAMKAGGDWILFPKIAFGDIAVTYDGNTLIGTSVEGEVKIANIADRKVLKSFKAHEGSVYICQACPDNKRFVTYGEDNIVKIWDMEGKELRRWDLGRNQGMFVLNLCFAPNGTQLVTGNRNSTVYVLDLP